MGTAIQLCSTAEEEAVSRAEDIQKKIDRLQQQKKDLDASISRWRTNLARERQRETEKKASQ